MNFLTDLQSKLETYDTADLPSAAPSARSLPSMGPEPESRVATFKAQADNYLYREPQPALPSALPFAFLHDVRVYMPPQLRGLRPAIEASYTRTGHQTPTSYNRTAKFINPAQDVAFQACHYYQALLERHATLAEPRGIVPTFFWALGNPPMMSLENSARFVAALRADGHVDAQNSVSKLLSEADVDRVLAKCPALQPLCQTDFARYASIVLQVAHDFVTFGRLDTWTALYGFIPATSHGDVPSDWSTERTHKKRTPQQRAQRADAIKRNFAGAFVAYKQDLANEAAWDAATSQARAARKNVAPAATKRPERPHKS